MSSGIISGTDHFLQLQLQRGLGPVGVEALRALVEERRVTPADHCALEKWEDAVHTNRGRGLKSRAAAFPTAPPTTASSRIDFRPDARPTHRIHVEHSARERMTQELKAAAPLDVETGGWLHAHQRPGLDLTVVCHASGPRPRVATRPQRASAQPGRGDRG